MDTDYIHYVGVFSSTLMAASLSYLISYSNPLSFLLLLSITLSYGFTVHISRNSFKYASLASLLCLFLVGFKPIVSAVSILIATSTPLLSYFSGGNKFKDFFNSVTIPLLISGIVLGSITYAEATRNPELQEEIRNNFQNVIGTQSQFVLKQVNPTDNLQNNPSVMIVRKTESIVLNNLSDSFNRSETSKLADSFDKAEKEMTERLKRSKDQNAEKRIKETSEQIAGKLVNQRNLIVLIPAFTLAMYSISPLVGLLTALSAIIFREISYRLS